MERQREEEAERFIRACYAERGRPVEDADGRVAEVLRSIRERGTYTHTAEELQHGARMAWRNSNRCIGRLFWETLQVIDARDAETEEEVAQLLLDHIEAATNGGKIRPIATIFRPEGAPERTIRIVNHQLIRYAGYVAEGGVTGDPASLALTRLCEGLGWKGEGTPYDILPLVVQIGSGTPSWFPLPRGIGLEVPIVHPDTKAFDPLGMRWYAVPIIADMVLDIGGIRYTAAPFNGWYMGTEIGARNLADTQRYDMLPRVATALGLDTSRDVTLWKDRALVELNAAVLHSFKIAGVSIVDHHTAARQFKLFEEKEEALGRPVTGDWTWLIPPLSPATTHLFHSSYRDEGKTPSFSYREPLL